MVSFYIDENWEQKPNFWKCEWIIFHLSHNMLWCHYPIKSYSTFCTKLWWQIGRFNHFWRFNWFKSTCIDWICSNSFAKLIERGHTNNLSALQSSYVCWSRGNLHWHVLKMIKLKKISQCLRGKNQTSTNAIEMKLPESYFFSKIWNFMKFEDNRTWFTGTCHTKFLKFWLKSWFFTKNDQKLT